MPPHGQPYGMVKPFETRMASMGTWALALGIVNLVQMGYGLLNTVVGDPSAQFANMPGGGPMDANAMQEAFVTFQEKVMFAETMRSLPFIAMSAWSVHMGMRLRKGDRAALKVAQQWVYGAFLTLAFSLAIQVFFTTPATLELFDKITASMPKSGAQAQEAKAMMESIMYGAVIVGLIMGTVVMAIWPVVLKIWSGRLIKEDEDNPGNAF